MRGTLARRITVHCSGGYEGRAHKNGDLVADPLGPNRGSIFFASCGPLLAAHTPLKWPGLNPVLEQPRDFGVGHGAPTLRDKRRGDLPFRNSLPHGALAHTEKFGCVLDRVAAARCVLFILVFHNDAV